MKKFRWLVLFIRYIAFLVCGIFCMLSVMLLTTIYSVSSTRGYMYILLVVFLSCISGFLARVAYDPHFLLRHLVALKYIFIVDIGEILPMNNQIYRGMNDVYWECRSTKEYYEFVLKLYDSYHSEMLMKERRSF